MDLNHSGQGDNVSGDKNVHNYFNSSPAEDEIDNNLICPFCGQVASIDSVQDNGKINCNNLSIGMHSFVCKTSKT